MIEIREALSRREQKEFLEFPLKLYKDNPCFVPPLWLDEKKIFDKDYLYLETCEAVYYNAYRDGKMVGRISGILQKASNEKTGQKRVRFVRFDTIEDFEVAKALFGKLEEWAISKGQEEIVGPLGFSDLEREGLLVEGFDQMSTFEEQYNASYYGEFLERLGFAKEVDWLEYRIYAPSEKEQQEMDKMAEFVKRRYKLRIGPAKNANDFLRKYMDGFFEVLDRSYESIYGTVPFTDKMKQLMKDNFKLIIDEKHVVVVLDENDKVILMGICFPSLAKTMRIADGHLTPKALVSYLKTMRRPEVIDLGLIGVEPEWLNRGVSVIVAAELGRMLRQPGTLYAESNLNLEDNFAIQNLWKRFNSVQNKRRRSYVKKIV